MKALWQDGKSVRKNVGTRLPRMVDAYFGEGRKAMKPDRTWEEMHTFRLATKKFRYTLELFRPVFDAEFDKRLEAMRRLQQLLGDISDAVSMRKLLEDLGDGGNLPNKLAKKAESGRKALIFHWESEFDAPGELDAWKAYLSNPPKKSVQKGAIEPPGLVS